MGADPAAAGTVLLRGLDRKELSRAWVRFEVERSDSAREVLVARYAPLVRFAARRVMLGLPALAWGGYVMGPGHTGLLAAVDEFDRAGEVRFETFALSRIRASMIDAIRARGGAPYSWQWHRGPVSNALSESTLEAILHQWREAARTLEARLGRRPTEEEVKAEVEVGRGGPADLIAIPESTIVGLDELWSVSDADAARVSLLDPFVEGHADCLQREREWDGGAFLMPILNEHAPDRPSVTNSAKPRDWIAEAMVGLDDRYRLLAWLTFYENMRVLDIGGLIRLASGLIPRCVGQAVLHLRSNLGTLPGSQWKYPDDPEQLVVFP